MRHGESSLRDSACVVAENSLRGQLMFRRKKTIHTSHQKQIEADYVGVAKFVNKLRPHCLFDLLEFARVMTHSNLREFIPLPVFV